MATVKLEPGLDEDVQSRMIELCKQHPQGVDRNMIMQVAPEIQLQQRLEILNGLIKSNRIQVLKRKARGKEEIIFRLIEGDNELEGGGIQERIVYSVICAAGNQGIWRRRIGGQTNISIKDLNKILKQLERRKLIKQVPSLHKATQVVYMKYSLEPDESMTGGAFYSNKTFDDEFASVFRAQCLRVLQMKADDAEKNFSADDPVNKYEATVASTKQILDFIVQTGVIKVDVSVTDVHNVLSTLVYDGTIKEVGVVSSGKASTSSEQDLIRASFRLAKPLIPKTGLMQAPCGYCPLIAGCREDGFISPKTCDYMKEWKEKLKLDF